MESDPISAVVLIERNCATTMWEHDASRSCDVMVLGVTAASRRRARTRNNIVLFAGDVCRETKRIRWPSRFGPSRQLDNQTPFVASDWAGLEGQRSGSQRVAQFYAVLSETHPGESVENAAVYTPCMEASLSTTF